MAAGRKRVDLGPDAEERILAGMARSESAESIAAALGDPKKASTVQRRMRELRGKARAASAAAAGQPPPAGAAALPEPEGVPANAHVDDLNGWLQIAEGEAKKARERGDIETLAKMVRLATTILDQRRKAMPPPRRDPDEQPDMIAGARRAREALHKLIDSATS